MKLEADGVQFCMGIIAMPWIFKVVYGFLSDNVDVFESRRRGHLLMNSVCCILAIGGGMTFGMYSGEYFATFCATLSQMNMAYSATVTEALMVQASAKGVKNGSENLNGLAYLF